MDADTLKRNAAARAIEEVKPGMKVGLGTGSTARHFVELLAEKVAGGWNVIGVPTSETTRADAERLGIALTTLDESPNSISLSMVPMRSTSTSMLSRAAVARLLREKIVAAASARMIVIADDTKLVRVLGRFRACRLRSCLSGWVRSAVQ